jgi:hypothetical protein
MNTNNRQQSKPVRQSLATRPSLIPAVTLWSTFRKARELVTGPKAVGLLILLTLSGCCNHPDYKPTFKVLDKTFDLLEYDLENGRLFPAVPLEIKAKDHQTERAKILERRLSLIKQARKTISTAARGPEK